MKKQFFLGIDIGTSSIKTLLVNMEGVRIASHTHLYQTMQPYPGYVEQDAESTWWAGAKEGIAHCLRESAVSADEIAGICASGMVPCLCPLDENGIPVRPAILYRDNRAVDQAARLSDQLGLPMNLERILPKLLWIKENEPAVFGRIRTVLNPHSYIAFKLTGECTVDHDIATLFGSIYDMHTHGWIPDRIEAAGFSPDLFPRIVWPLDIIGHVTNKAAFETGLAEGTPVISGTGDSYTALVGCGAVDAREGLIYLGTAATFLGLTVSLDKARGECIFESGNGRFLGNVLTGGEITHWAKDSLFRGSSLGYQDLEKAASSIPVGSEGLIALPHLLGERTPVENPLSTGVLFGFSNAHTLGHTYRALLEGVAYALKDSYNASSFPLSRLILFGGGANCGLWRQIIADVLDMPLEYIPGADNALGTAYLVGMALGTFSSFSTIKDEWLQQKELIVPDRRRAEVYAQYFAFYKELNALLRPAFTKHHTLVSEIGHISLR